MNKIDVNNIKLTDEQKEIFNESMKSLKEKGQAAILLSMGGGKSYISAKIIKALKGNKENYRVLWISTNNSISNTQSLLTDKYFTDSITYVSFSSLSLNENYIDFLKLDKVNLIVIDEAHRALAKQTEKGIKYIFKKYNKAKILAMTATKTRFSDRRRVFNGLTPKLELGVDYKDRGLKYSVENKIVCDFVYKTCDIQMLKTYCAAIKELEAYSSIYKEYDNLVAEAERIIGEYSDNTFHKLGEQIRQDLVYDGSEGDRWFVFYHLIDELEQNKEDIREMFRIAYNNPDLTINIIEYHSKLDKEDEDTVIERINSIPKKNTVDLILTCNRGSESLHPENTRGVVMLRGTASETIIEQQMGRCLGAREFNSGCRYIYDFVNNKARVSGYATIYNGSDAPDDRRISSIEKLLKSANSTQMQLEKIAKKYNNCFDIEILDDDICSLVDKFRKVKEMFESLYSLKRIDAILRSAKGVEDYTDIVKHGIFSPNLELNRYDLYHGTNYSKDFETIQKRFISGSYGEHKMNEPECDDAFYQVYNILGDVVYLAPQGGETCGYSLVDLIKIAREVKKYDYDYTNRISKTKELKRKIADLRMLNINRKLSEAFQKYCTRNLIDIDGIYTNLIDEVLSSDEASSNPELITEFKRLSRAFSNMNTENTDDILNVLSSEHIFNVKYLYNSFGKQAITAIRIMYKDKIRLLRKVANKEDYDNATKIIECVIKMSKFEVPETPEEMHNYSTKINEAVIIDLVKRDELNKVSKYELGVLKNLGISVENSRRSINIRKLLDKTPYGISYAKFMQTSDKEWYRFVNRYKISGLPQCMQQQLNRNKFKDCRNQVEKDMLMIKDNIEIKGIIAELYYVDEDSINKIKSAIKNREVDSRSLIKYAIPDRTYGSCRSYFDKAMKTNWNKLDANDRAHISSSLSKDNSCYNIIIKNLLKADLIPDEQKELANELIQIAQ